MQVLTARLLVDCYFDSEAAAFVHKPTVIAVSQQTGLIHDISPYHGELSPDESTIIDLRGLTVLPGFVDTHVHRKLSIVCHRINPERI